MKGLLLKEFYMVSKYCRSFLLVIAVFLIASFFSKENMFFAVYPTILAGFISMTLLSYDERERWNVYSASLPYTKAQLVSSKYIIGLIFEMLVFIISSAAQAVRMINSNAFEINMFLSFVSVIFVLGIIGPSLLLPFVFKLGAEKGRLAYYVLIGIMCSTGIIFTGKGVQNISEFTSLGKVVAPMAAGVLIYAVSWCLSIKFYKERTL